MPRPIGRPPENLLAQLRAYILNPATTETELAFLDGALWSFKAEKRGEPTPRRRKADGDKHEVELIENADNSR